MSLQIYKNKIRNFISINYFWVMIAGYLLALITGNFSVVILSSMMLITIILLNISMKIRMDIVSIYVVYLLLSGIVYLFNGRPKTLYIHAVAYMILPMTMYFLPKNNAELFMKRSMDAIFFSLIIAVILYIWPPHFYVEYLYNRSLIGKNDIRWIRPSLIQGLYGLTTVSNFATACAFYYYMHIGKKKYSFIKFFLCAAIVLYAKRRAATAGLFAGLVVANLIFLWKGKIAKKQIMMNVFICLCTFAAILLFCDQVTVLAKSVLSVGAAVSERSGNWHDNLSTIGLDVVFGRGLGSHGHIAGSMGLSGVFDSQYVLMVMENGIAGVILFGASVVYSFAKCIKFKCVSTVPMLIVILFLIQCIGSNVLEMPLPAAIFWYSLSYMQQKKEKTK